MLAKSLVHNAQQILVSSLPPPHAVLSYLYLDMNEGSERKISQVGGER